MQRVFFLVNKDSHYDVNMSIGPIFRGKERGTPVFLWPPCRADTCSQDHSQALRAYIWGPPEDWRRRTGRPRQTWLRTVEDDLRPLNFGLITARRHALDRSTWHQVVEAATSIFTYLLTYLLMLHAPKREGEPPLPENYSDSAGKKLLI